MADKYFKNIEGAVFVNPILKKYPDGSLTEMTEEEFDIQLAINNSPPKLTLDEAKEKAASSVKNFATDTRAKLTGYADQYQLAGWVSKSEVAKRVLTGTGTATAKEVASIQAEVDKRGRGETVEELANKQLDKSIKLAMASAIIDGLESAAIHAINEAKTLESLTLIMDELKSNADAELALLMSAAT